MKIAKVFVSILVLVFIVSTGLSQDERKARLSGVVVKAGSDTPLPRINIELQDSSGGGDAATLTTTTNEKGEFAFVNLASGRYRLAASGAGYLRVEYGQAGLSGSGIVFPLAPAQEKIDFRFALTPTAAISGRVVNASGEPLINADVVAFKESFSSGQRQLFAIRAVRSDDSGNYRLFWLPPGQYYIGAQPAEGIVTTTILNNVAGTDSTSIFGVRRTTRDVTVSLAGTRPGQKGASLLTYFPGTYEGQSALVIDAPAGADIRNVDFIVRRVDTYRVRGNVLGAPAGGNAQVQVRLLRSIQPPLQQYSASTNATTGVFEFSGVIPGPYILFATGPGGLSGRLNIEVGAADVDATVSLRSDLSLPIRVRKERQSEGPIGVDGLRVDIVMDPWVNTGFALRRSVPVAGTLTANLSVGEYRVFVSPILSQQSSETVPQNLRNLYVKSLRLDGVDVLNSPLHLERQPEGTLEIVLGVTSGTISGLVSSESQSPVARATVVLVPKTPSSYRRDMYRVVRSDDVGRFRFSDLVPGDYRILAFDDVEADAWLNPEFLKLYGEVPLHVDEDTNKEMNVAVSRKTR